MSLIGEMYHVRPYHSLTGDVELCNVMYKVPKLQEEIHIHTKKGSSEIHSLKNRQDQLLCFLDQLISETSSCQISSDLISCDNKNKAVLDIVLQAHPKKPPRSLKFIHQLLKKKFRVLCKTHVHSSVKEHVDLSLLEFNETSTDRSQFDIVITLILTEAVEYPLATIDPANVSSISGESNVARLFGRLIGVYDSGSTTLPLTSQIDVLLDACDVIMFSTSSPNDKLSAVKILEDALQRGPWLCGSERSLADAVAFSALVQSNTSFKSPAGQKWMNAQLAC